jgi:predicted transporter
VLCPPSDRNSLPRNLHTPPALSPSLLYLCIVFVYYLFLYPKHIKLNQMKLQLLSVKDSYISPISCFYLVSSMGMGLCWVPTEIQ